MRNLPIINLGRMFVSTQMVELVSEFCQDQGQNEITIVDFGTGQASLLQMMIRVAQRNPSKRFRLIGYDPHMNIGQVRSRILVANAIRGSEGRNYSFELTTSKPRSADIVFAHFSLHHTPSVRHAVDQIASMHPRYVLIAEYDFKTDRVGLTEFLDIFRDSEACRCELAQFRQTAGDRDIGNDMCWQYHLQNGMADYIFAVKTAGGTITRIHTSGTVFKFERHKFLIEALF